MERTTQILHNSLKASGYSAPCATDMAGYLASCLARPSSHNLSDVLKDIEDIIKALEAYKLTLKA